MAGDPRLAAYPRVELGHWPTPLQHLDRHGFWVKRDDCSGLALGGNKTRKLEYLLGRARAEGADGVVTFGALQSNHARQTAAACARLGLTCDLVLARAVDRTDDHYLRSGNLLLDGLLGATVHAVDDPDAAFTRFAELVGEAEAAGRHLFGILPGGSDETGVLGYVDGALELAGQAAEAGLDLRRVVVAASTAGTAAGLVLGLAVAGVDAVVDAVCVYEPAEATGAALAGLVAAGAGVLGIPVPDAARWRVTDAALGGGYGVPTGEGLAAISLLARTEGLLLDPVYTGKAVAHLLATPAEGTVLVHTGGAPGLFAYTPALA